MKIFLTWFICSISLGMSAQTWEVKKHPNMHRYAITTDSGTSEYLYSEVSELCEGKAYVAQGDLYAYLDSNLRELTPYVLVEAHNFINGYAIVGDSINRNLINSKMQIILPVGVAEVRMPTLGLITVRSHEGTWGLFDIFGRERLPMIYDLPPKVLNKELIIVRKSDVYGIVNDCNETVYPIGFQYISVDGLGYKNGKYLRLF